MSSIFIHVGLHKTASTWLQKKVFPNFKELQLVSRPYTNRNTCFNKLQFANDFLYNEEEFKEEFKKIQSYANGKSILISDENLSGLPMYNYVNRTQIASRLARVMPNAEIIVFIRGQEEIIKSLHNQSIKTGWFYKELNEKFIWRQKKEYTWENYFQGDTCWDINSSYVNHFSPLNWDLFLYYELIKLYEKYFKKVHVFVYEELRQNPELILSKFSKIFKMEIDEIDSTVNINKRIDESNVKDRILTNRIKQLNLSNKYFRSFFKHMIGIADLFESKSNKNNFTSEDFAKYYSKNNKKMADEYSEIDLMQYSEYFCKSEGFSQ